jgi:hypothetical protein
MIDFSLSLDSCDDTQEAKQTSKHLIYELKFFGRWETRCYYLDVSVFICGRNYGRGRHGVMQLLPPRYGICLVGATRRDGPGHEAGAIWSTRNTLWGKS